MNVFDLFFSNAKASALFLKVISNLIHYIEIILYGIIGRWVLLLEFIIKSVQS